MFWVIKPKWFKTPQSFYFIHDTWSLRVDWKPDSMSLSSLLGRGGSLLIEQVPWAIFPGTVEEG